MVTRALTRGPRLVSVVSQAFAMWLAFSTSSTMPRTAEIGISVLEIPAIPRQQRRQAGHDGRAGVSASCGLLAGRLTGSREPAPTMVSVHRRSTFNMIRGIVKGDRASVS